MAKEFSFDAADKKVQDVLFAKIRKYRVPRYQRPYAWGIEQATEFWEDLISNSEPYFIGSFVFCTEKEKEEGFVEIIDGQQRLLTITMFMAVLRDHTKNIDKSKSELYQRQDIADEDRAGKYSYFITPDEPIKGVFVKYIQNVDGDMTTFSPKTSEEKRLKENYIYFYERVRELLEKAKDKEAKLLEIEGLRKKVSNLVVINVEIEREEDAYEIFETTNARGVDLSVSDLLKNLIFRKLPAQRDKDKAKVIWKEITDDIQETNTELKKFIRYHWLSKYSSVTEKQLYREIKNKIKEDEWGLFLDDLKVDSEIFNLLLEGEWDTFKAYKNSDLIFNSVFALRLMDVTQCYVLLLCILRNYKSLGSDPSRIFAVIEKFTFQYSVICNQPGNKPEKLYSKYAIELENECSKPTKNHVGNVQRIFANLESSLKAIRPSKTLFSEQWAEISYRNSEKSRKIVKYMLDRINSYYGTTSETKVDFNNVNVEHLLPQTPDKAWGVTKKDIKPYVNMLGNLTLIDERINSRVQNKLIKHKLKELKKSQLPITIEIVKKLKAHKMQWGEPQIVGRQKELGKIAYEKIWSF